MLSDTPNSNEGSIMPESLTDQIAEYIGAIVTIYTVSGGESGGGFTGVLFKVTTSFVRLISCVSPAPCTGGCRNRPVNNVGSIADIPLDKIAAFVNY